MSLEVASTVINGTDHLRKGNQRRQTYIDNLKLLKVQL